MKATTTFLSKVSLLTTIVSVSFAVNILFAAWQSPPADPPNGNVATPVNVGTTDQDKNAALGVNALSVFGDGYVQNNFGIGATPGSEIFRIDHPDTSGDLTDVFLASDNSGNQNAFRVRIGDEGVGRSIVNIGSDYFNNNGQSDITFSTRNGGGALSEKMRIQGGGNVGINYKFPSSPLEVNGTVEADQYCDRTKSNCFSASDVSSGGGGIGPVLEVGYVPTGPGTQHTFMPGWELIILNGHFNSSGDDAGSGAFITRDGSGNPVATYFWGGVQGQFNVTTTQQCDRMCFWLDGSGNLVVGMPSDNNVEFTYLSLGS